METGLTYMEINNLFLARDKHDYSQAQNLVTQQALKDYTILPIQDEFPYWRNNNDNFDNLSKWEDYGIRDLRFSRYWLDEYKQIEEIITTHLTKKRKYNNQIARSPHFIFGLVWECGRDYYDPIDALHNFFIRYKPKIVYFNPSESFIRKLLLSFINLYKIQFRPLGP